MKLLIIAVVVILVNCVVIHLSSKIVSQADFLYYKIILNNFGWIITIFFHSKQKLGLERLSLV